MERSSASLASQVTLKDAPTGNRRPYIGGKHGNAGRNSNNVDNPRDRPRIPVVDREHLGAELSGRSTNAINSPGVAHQANTSPIHGLGHTIDPGKRVPISLQSFGSLS